MTVKAFIKAVSDAEGKHQGVPFAQIREVISATNKLLDGQLYKLIRSTK